MPSFKQFQFQPFINEALAEKGFEEPTEVQEKLIPIIQEVERRILFYFH